MTRSMRRLRLPIAAALVALAATGLALVAGEPAATPSPRVATELRVEHVRRFGQLSWATKSKVEEFSTADVDERFPCGVRNTVRPRSCYADDSAFFLAAFRYPSSSASVAQPLK